jgi:hypothetical protein
MGSSQSGCCYYSGPCGVDYNKPDVIHENEIQAELEGHVKDDDYLGKAHKHLTSLQIDEAEGYQTDPSKFVDIDQAYKLLEPGFDGLEHG